MSPDIAASVRARLLTQAKQRGEEFERTLARFAAERLLYRLGQSPARERCVLKGASLLSVWLPDPYRATRDVDVLASGTDDEAAIRDLIRQICAQECRDDGIQFDLESVQVADIRAESEHVGKRAWLIAHLAKARIRVQIDFGFGDDVVTPLEDITYPTLLADLPAPNLRAYPREVSVAEKFEAMVTLDRRNSRMKDFHDVWALSTAFTFDGLRLRSAVAACFARRRTAWTAEAPGVLTNDFYVAADLEQRWTRYLAAGSVLIAPPGRFETVGRHIITFLGPVRNAITLDDPFDAHWPAGGPWEMAA
ncbi:MAG: nucleotidyl transferase AbiEii/AbiGii toxin family protein [Acidobacteria bacterium]|jgi:predicted nucleotidyltransferase component of viral defense system|nr:nucleotidyl transferase AbiEii/AbiGii toxin family protein [Acidobacteriota bacterium]